MLCLPGAFLSCEKDTMLRCVFSSFLALAAILSAFGQDVKSDWTIESHSVELTAPTFSFLDEHLPPEVPSAGSSDEEWLEFISKSSKFASSALNELGIILPEGALFAYDPASLTLAARLPQTLQADLAEIVDATDHDRFIAFNLHILEAPAATVRNLVNRASEQADHRPLFEELVTLTKTKKGRYVHSGYVTTRSGENVKSSDARTVSYTDSLTLNRGKPPTQKMGTISVGTSWELDTVLSADIGYFDVYYVLWHDFAPPKRHEVSFDLHDSAPFSASIVDTYSSQASNSVTMQSGTAKLVGTWNPTSGGNKPAPDVHQAAFIIGDVVPNLPLKNERLVERLRMQGDAIAKVPKGPLKSGEGFGMKTISFRVPPGFLKYEPSDDPFADLGGSVAGNRKGDATAKEVLESAGIPFPPGAFAKYLRPTSTLMVRNTQENLDLIETFTSSQGPGPPTSIGFALHVVQAPAVVLRELADECRTLADHSPAWKTLQSGDDAEFLATHWMEGHTGQMCQLEAGERVMYLLPGEPNADGGQTIEAKTKCVGTSWKLEPVIGADGQSIDLNVELIFDYAPAEIIKGRISNQGEIALGMPTFSEARSNSSMTFLSGATRMLSMWKPTSNVGSDQPDLLHAAFLTATIIRAPEIEP